MPRLPTARFYCHAPSPLGVLLLATDGHALTDLHIESGLYVPAVQAHWVHAPEHPVLQQCQQELREYFAGQRRRFDLALAPQGTAFQQRAWAALLQIPYGRTISYGQQAQHMGQPKAMRAVGAANGKNPISIIIPCHRVIGANGSLTGYSGGLQHKIALLQLEGVLI